MSPPPGRPAGSAYVILWEYQVKPPSRRAFEAAYGPGGAWELLFRQGEGYLGTELLRNASVEGSFLTVDRWKSSDAYEAFRRDRRDAYEELDRRCDPFTERERCLGSFTTAV